MIKPLILKVTTSIVSHGHRLFNVGHGVQMGQDIILKTTTFVTMNLSWNTLDIESFVNQDLHDGKFLLVVSNEGLTEPSKGTSQH